jgi:hypothetical protein
MAREQEQVKGVADKAGGAIKDGANNRPINRQDPDLTGRLVHRTTITST